MARRPRPMPDCRMMVSLILPFLACSPDGILFDGHDFKLLEIKCPVKGISHRLEDIIKKLPYLSKDGQLRKKHAYYGQVQLGMAICGISKTDFIIYSKCSNDYHKIEIFFF